MGLARGGRAFSGVETLLKHWICAVPLLLFVTVMAAPQLDLIAPEVDEFYFMNDAGMIIDGPYSPLDVVASVIRNSPNHTPLYFILLNLWGHLVGYEIALARALTLLIALLSLAMIYRLTRDFSTPLAGLLALIVVLSNAFFNFYFANARMYPLLVLLAALSLWLYLRIVHGTREARTRDYAALTFVCYLLANTHAFSALLFLAVGAYHLLQVRKDRRWLNASLAVLLALLLFSPWLGVLLTSGLERNSASFWPESGDLGQVLAALQAVAFNDSAILLLLALAGLVMSWRDHRPRTARFLSIALYFLLAFSLVAHFSEDFGASKVRLALAGWPVLIALIAIGLVSWIRWRKWLASFALLWILAGLSFQQTADWRALFAGRERPYAQPAWHIVSRMAQQSFPSAPILTYLVDLTDIHWPAYINYPQSRYYFADRGLELVTYEDRGVFRDYVLGQSNVTPFLRVFYQTARVDAAALEALDATMRQANYEECELSEFGIDTVLVLYAWPILDCGDPIEPAAAENELISYFLYGAEVDRAEDKIVFVDQWRARKAFAAESINLSHQLISAEWENVAQLDLPLVHENSLRQFLIDIADVPAGSYRLVTILYDSRTRERFDWIDNPDNPAYMLALSELAIPER
ncbi:MAG: glycosyltransferase family 39 protein [Chloroflexota bacterium]|nr:glycosyltransferase family 39 protein [Chloroflexota bacterium]